ncbi:MAG: FtsX-like permease family protein [Clostridiales bacterium]|nr:FtsX-like permease family protein [Clostridiales bacterium]
MLDEIKRRMSELCRNRLRLFLTVGGITIGVLSVIIISILGEVGKTTVDKKLTSMGLDSVVVSVNSGQGSGLCENDLYKLTDVEEIRKAIPLMSLVTYSIIRETNSDCMLWGINEDANNVIDLDVLHGRLINKGDVSSNARVCLIDEELARESYSRSNIVGKKISVEINGTMQEYEIIGIVRNGVNVLQSMLGNVIPSFVYIPYTTFQNASAKNSFDQIAVKLHDTNISINDKIETIITAGNNDRTAVSVENLLGQKDALSSILDIVTIILTFIAGISLLVSGLSIMTVMMVAVSERTREIGIKKSIGASKGDILTEFLIESALITLLGSAIGIALGILIGIIGCVIMDIEIMINIKLVLGVFIFTLFTGLTFGVYPAYRASKLKPVEALRL